MGKLGSPTRLHKAEAVASSVVDQVQALDGVEEVLIAGSVRRQRPIVSDVDLVVVTNEVQDLTIYRHTIEGIVWTPRSGYAMYDGVRVELFIAPPLCAGATLQFLTGPGSLNIWLRMLAKNRGWKLSQYGLWSNPDPEDKKAVKERYDRSTGDPYADERSIFEALEIDYMEPQDRDMWREIKRARK